VSAPSRPPPVWVPPAHAKQRWTSRTELARAGWLIVALAAIGLPIGWLWQAISPHTVGVVLNDHAIIPAQTEALIASDAWFALLTGAVGGMAAVLSWLRADWRGPTMSAALAIGGLAGSLIASWVGQLTGGGRSGGALHEQITLQIAVRAHALLAVEPLIAVWLICLLALFTRHDDLGRGSPASPPPEPGWQTSD
jgi:Protein of unknown function (DUF2567)